MDFPRLESLLSPSELESIAGQLLLACSGGADSVYLFHLLRQSNIPFIVAHVNHGTRAEESDGDESFVRDLCNTHNVVFFSKSISAEKHDESSLRDLRYHALKSLADEHQCRNIAFAHHRDDQGETFFLAALRASGIDGLSSMQRCRKTEDGYTLLRPLLGVSRSHIIRTLRVNDLGWREDSSNESLRYQRNLLRHEFFPQLAKDFPDALPNLARSAELCLDTRQTLDSYREVVLKSLLVGEDDRGVLLDSSTTSGNLLRDTLRNVCRRILREERSSSPGGLPEELLSTAVLAAQKFDHVWRHDMTNRGTVLIANGFVLVVRNVVDGEECFSELLSGRYFLEAGGSFEQHFQLDRIPCIDEPRTVVCVDDDKLSGSLRIECLDKFKKINLRDGKSKDVATALREARVPAFLRERCYCVADDRGIVWIPGVRQAAHTLVTEGTKSIVRLRWLNQSS